MTENYTEITIADANDGGIIAFTGAETESEEMELFMDSLLTEVKAIYPSADLHLGVLTVKVPEDDAEAVTEWADSLGTDEGDILFKALNVMLAEFNERPALKIEEQDLHVEYPFLDDASYYDSDPEAEDQLHLRSFIVLTPEQVYRYTDWDHHPQRPGVHQGMNGIIINVSAETTRDELIALMREIAELARPVVAEWEITDETHWNGTSSNPVTKLIKQLTELSVAAS